jgi:hypothetical protein
MYEFNKYIFQEVKADQSTNDLKYGEYTNKYNKSVNQYNTTWDSNNLNYLGVKPPKNNLLPVNFNSNIDKNKTPLIQISSFRKPYNVQYLINKYGGLKTKLGTNLGN